MHSKTKRNKGTKKREREWVRKLGSRIPSRNLTLDSIKPELWETNEQTRKHTKTDKQTCRWALARVYGWVNFTKHTYPNPSNTECEHAGSPSTLQCIYSRMCSLTHTNIYITSYSSTRAQRDRPVSLVRKSLSLWTEIKIHESIQFPHGISYSRAWSSVMSASTADKVITHSAKRALLTHFKSSELRPFVYRRPRCK